MPSKSSEYRGWTDSCNAIMEREAKGMNAYKGQLSFDNERCILCQTCAFVCPAGAIDISAKTSLSYDFTIWHHSCTLCGNCTYYCPTGAISLSTLRPQATPQSQKFSTVTSHVVLYATCPSCHESMIKTPTSLLQKGFTTLSEPLKELFTLCPNCRRTHTFEKRVL